MFLALWCYRDQCREFALRAASHYVFSLEQGELRAQFKRGDVPFLSLSGYSSPAVLDVSISTTPPDLFCGQERSWAAGGSWVTLFSSTGVIKV